MSERNLTRHLGLVTSNDRARVMGHRAATVWLTGLSGSGKSTLCTWVEKRLLERNVLAYVLDGDNVRMGLNRDLGFSAREREENIRRIGEVARLMTDAGLIVLTAFISPFREDRARVRRMFEQGSFFEVHVATPLEECERRDPKGLYARARKGEIREFTGIDSPYEPPESAELVIGRDEIGVEVGVCRIMSMLEVHQIIPKRPTEPL